MPFLLSTRALSLLRRARDLVNASMVCSACSSVATLRLMYSEPLFGCGSPREGDRPLGGCLIEPTNWNCVTSSTRWTRCSSVLGSRRGWPFAAAPSCRN